MTLRVGTYNIRHGADVELDFSILAQDIVNNHIDVCGIQEVDEDTTRNGNQKTMEILSKQTGMPFFAFTKAIDLQGGGYGTGILSKFPIVSMDSQKLPSGKYEQRAYGHVVLNVGGMTMDFYNTHLTWDADEICGRYRDEQLRVLADAVRGKERWILTGDFNTEDFSRFFVFDHVHIVNNEKSKMLSHEKDGAIDNILCADNAAILKYGLCNEVRHSDHSMLWADISFV